MEEQRLSKAIKFVKHALFSRKTNFSKYNPQSANLAPCIIIIEEANYFLNVNTVCHFTNNLLQYFILITAQQSEQDQSTNFINKQSLKLKSSFQITTGFNPNVDKQVSECMDSWFYFEKNKNSKNAANMLQWKLSQNIIYAVDLQSY